MTVTVKDVMPLFAAPIVGFVLYHYLKRTGRLHHLSRISLTTAMVLFVLTEAGRSFYRPYIYSHEIDDFGIADTIGNSLGTATAVFFVAALAGRGTRRDLFLIAFVVFGLVLYETSNFFFGHPVDIRDIMATLAFGALSSASYAVMLTRIGSTVEDSR
jgi:FtsH-binding integral membrane protein